MTPKKAAPPPDPFAGTPFASAKPRADDPFAAPEPAKPAPPAAPQPAAEPERPHLLPAGLSSLARSGPPRGEAADGDPQVITRPLALTPSHPRHGSQVQPGACAPSPALSA